jgi:predicted nucleic acid-binding protein
VIEIVVDTNVLAISERVHEGASDGCVSSCVELARQISEGEVMVLMDDCDEILLEYLKHLEHHKTSGVGVKIAQRLKAGKFNQQVCRRVPITPLTDNSGSYEEVPEALRDFDDDDQKFFAVAVASHARPKIYAGLDGEWWSRSNDFVDSGFDVQFCCSSDLIVRYGNPGN